MSHHHISCWDCWNVEFKEDAVAIPMEEFELKGLQCKATPYFGDGEGGAGVLLAVAGSLMGE